MMVFESGDSSDEGTSIAREDEVDDDNDDATDFKISEELLKKEREYIRMNREIQSKSAKIVRAVEDVVREGRETLVRPVTAPCVSRAAEDTVGPAAGKTTRRPQTGRTVTPANSKRRKGTQPVASLSKSSHQKEAAHSSTPLSRNASADMPQQTVESQSLSGLPPDVTDEAIGSEAANRILKARLQMMQQDMDRLISEHETKNEMISSLDQRLKLADTENSKLSKGVQSLQSQVDKYKKQNEELKKRVESTEGEAATLKKDMEAKARAQRQSETEGNAKDVRLNRALDEIERHKQAAARTAADTKEKLEESKRVNEKLLADLRRVQKQKGELLTAFRKQAQLIDVLKRQKMHIEAAKLLDFTEEEFVRALNWEV
ncbi:uncharacterized protein SPPG_09015 [Spizellomyces punctatus DAOM BR117]|uniref:Testis expressed 9 n=1 Tax=Spizellomyces punctatus (strain DAOM BR117) TaxID=645134 RepID=A0A0L0HQF1_SPIPD|nr:uncharacterized protein SPPG_09015 [Spizellomyces punctatus DAOM BR117]KND03288.1 hypothetical protein SPPG_09015 [Spizellomyces punctatus DAOM BR117]|eukprot:XP_016611327.1 hypothetical protein SPPG_09015 [Spizellomyces punctatus DAOM BR117]